MKICRHKQHLCYYYGVGKLHIFMCNPKGIQFYGPYYFEDSPEKADKLRCMSFRNFKSLSELLTK